MNERPIPTTHQPLRGDVPLLQDQLPLRLSRWTAMKALYVSWRAGFAAESAYGTATAGSASRDVGPNAAYKSSDGEERPIQDGGDEERARHVVDTGHGDPSLRARGPATEMDQALGALASYRETANTNADTQVMVFCVLVFASLALLGFYPFYSARTSDATTAATQSIACEREDASLTTARDAKFRTPCRSMIEH